MKRSAHLLPPLLATLGVIGGFPAAGLAADVLIYGATPDGKAAAVAAAKSAQLGIAIDKLPSVSGKVTRGEFLRTAPALDNRNAPAH